MECKGTYFFPPCDLKYDYRHCRQIFANDSYTEIQGKFSKGLADKQADGNELITNIPLFEMVLEQRVPVFKHLKAVYNMKVTFL